MLHDGKRKNPTFSQSHLEMFDIFVYLSSFNIPVPLPADAHKPVKQFHINPRCQSPPSVAQLCYLLK